MIFRPLFACLATGLLLAGCADGPTTQAAVPAFDPNDASAVGTVRFARPVGSADALQASAEADRDAFASDRAAQVFFLQAGGPTDDPHDLDRDGDGFACEWGVSLRRAEDARAAAAQRRMAAASRCYTGPRGGTYTITASGGRNYDGC